MSRIPVTILTGFLGAGKTTLLNRLIAMPGFGDTAVVINEFGDAGVDAALVTDAGERAFAMTTGCLCCTVSGDIRLTLLRLLDEAERGVGPGFSRIVIETTGLADPAPVLHAFMNEALMLQSFALNGVVTLVDAVTGDATLTRFEEARRQAGVADLLLISKSDLAKDPASIRDLEALRGRLGVINPNARIRDADQASAEEMFSLAAFDPAGKAPDIARWLQFEATHDHGAHHHAHHANRHGDDIEAFCFTSDEPVAAGQLDNAIDVLRRALGQDLLRLKGLVELEGRPDEPRLVHVVQHITSPPRLLGGWPEGIDETRLVLIASGPRRAEATAAFSETLAGLRAL